MIRIQTFRPEYSDGVVNVILPIQQNEFGIPITLDAQPDLLDICNFYQHGNGNFWVAEDAGRVVGTIAALDIGNQQVALRKMFVAAPHRGRQQGIASSLLQTLIIWCRERGVREIFLGTTALFLAAHRFYEKNHFVEVDRGELPEAFPVMAVDSKFYCQKLNQVPNLNDGKRDLVSTPANAELDALVEAWIAHFCTPVVQDQDHVFMHRDNSATEWASEQVLNMVIFSPESLWRFVLEVLRRNPPVEVIENLAAGPLEDYLARCGETVIEQVERQAEQDPRFRSLLGGVWQNQMSDEVWARVCACRDTSEWY